MACKALGMQDEVAFLMGIAHTYRALAEGLSFNCPVPQELWRKLAAGSDAVS